MKILTAVVNNPIFIQLQYHTLQKYVIGSYEFIVFNDAKDFPDYTNGNDITTKRQIEDVCKRLSITCINIPNKHHKIEKNVSIRCADSMNYILEYQKQHPDKYLVLDSDMFLIDYLDIHTHFNYDCAIVLQERPEHGIVYFWNGIYYFDITKMNNIHLLNWNCCLNADVGGMMRRWLTLQVDTPPSSINASVNITELRGKSNIYCIPYIPSGTWDIRDLPPNLQTNQKLIEFLTNDVRNTNEKLFCEVYDNVFLHYRSGANWRNEGLRLHAHLSHMLANSLL